MKTPIYKLLLLVLNSKYLKDETHGLCSQTNDMYYNIDAFNDIDYERILNYIKYHKVFNVLLRYIYFQFNYMVSPDFYWKKGWILPRRLYLIRHIFYCWLWYWCIIKPFKSK